MSTMTLFCDASHCHATKSAGWGAWAKRDGWEKGAFMGGPFKTTIHNNSEAELCAIANAISFLQANDDFDGIRMLMVQSDSLRALGLIATHVKGTQVTNHDEAATVVKIENAPVSPTEKRALVRLNAFKFETQVSLYVRHVKGHAQGEGRQWVNRQCDRIAREHMRAARNGVKWVDV